MKISLRELGLALQMGLEHPISRAYLFDIFQQGQRHPEDIMLDIQKQLSEAADREKEVTDRKVMFITDLKLLKAEYAETAAQRRVLDNLIKKVENT